MCICVLFMYTYSIWIYSHTWGKQDIIWILYMFIYIYIYICESTTILGENKDFIQAHLEWLWERETFFSSLNRQIHSLKATSPNTRDSLEKVLNHNSIKCTFTIKSFAIKVDINFFFYNIYQITMLSQAFINICLFLHFHFSATFYILKIHICF